MRHPHDVGERRSFRRLPLPDASVFPLRMGRSGWFPRWGIQRQGSRLLVSIRFSFVEGLGLLGNAEREPDPARPHEPDTTDFARSRVCKVGGDGSNDARGMCPGIRRSP